jgi:hypothetical protein
MTTLFALQVMAYVLSIQQGLLEKNKVEKKKIYKK